jgi:3-hydroxyacyl-[acyl-carrier-protein] dehydratase
MKASEILARLPYARPFLFVDAVREIDEEGVEGTFTFREDLPFFRGHFRDFPVTPGVLLTECCAQIGLACLAIYLGSIEGREPGAFALSSSDMEFYIPVYPGEKVTVRSRKEYFRFNKLKCEVRMYNNARQLVCKGVLAGMLKPQLDE